MTRTKTIQELNLKDGFYVWAYQWLCARYMDAYTPGFLTPLPLAKPD